MLIHDFQAIGNKLLTIRKKVGLTQAEVAEAAGLADRTYADIERGFVNMRIETILRICDALHTFLKVCVIIVIGCITCRELKAGNCALSMLYCLREIGC